MKIWIQYIGFFGLGILLFSTLLSVSKNPETMITGQWKELVWEYEKLDKNDTVKADYKVISAYVKDAVGQHLIVHKAEKWLFYPNGKLLLKGNNFSKKATWTLKGRGNILALKYEDNTTEKYNLTELSKNKLVLNFDTDAHARGIARLTLEK